MCSWPSTATSGLRRDVFRAERRRQVHFSIVIAPLTRALPAKNRQLDDGYTVGAHGRRYGCDILEALLGQRLKDQLLFDGLTLAASEMHFRKFSKAENFRISPHMLRHAGLLTTSTTTSRRSSSCNGADGGLRWNRAAAIQSRRACFAVWLFFRQRKRRGLRRPRTPSWRGYWRGWAEPSCGVPEIVARAAVPC